MFAVHLDAEVKVRTDELADGLYLFDEALDVIRALGRTRQPAARGRHAGLHRLVPLGQHMRFRLFHALGLAVALDAVARRDVVQARPVADGVRPALATHSVDYAV